MKHFRLKIKTKTKSKMPPKINTGPVAREDPTPVVSEVTTKLPNFTAAAIIKMAFAFHRIDVLGAWATLESTPEPSPVQESSESTPERYPVREPSDSTPEPSPVYESAPELTQVYEFIPELTPIYESWRGPSPEVLTSPLQSLLRSRSSLLSLFQFMNKLLSSLKSTS